MNNGNQKQDRTANDALKLGAIAVTPIGMAPVTATWRFTQTVLEEQIKNAVKDYIDDVEFVELNCDSRGENLIAIAWIPSRSKHLVAKSDNLAINKPIRVFSPQLNELFNRYGIKEKKVFPDPSNPKLSGIGINIVKVMNVLLDTAGIYSNETYGYGIKTKLTIQPNYYEKKDKSEMPRFKYLEVTKDASCRTTRRPNAIRALRH